MVITLNYINTCSYIYITISFFQAVLYALCRLHVKISLCNHIVVKLTPFPKVCRHDMMNRLGMMPKYKR